MGKNKVKINGVERRKFALVDQGKNSLDHYH